MLFCAATGNQGKLQELRRILQAQGHSVKSQAELGIALQPEETGTTFAQNATIKAREICQQSGIATIADDSGLVVDALGGAPGVYSARYCGVHGNDAANNQKLLENLQATSLHQRTARFVSAVCLCLPNGATLVCEGVCEGTITLHPAGENGFGYDPLFVPSRVGVAEGQPLCGNAQTQENTQNQTYAQLTAQQKDAISHRGAAMAKLAQRLPAFLCENEGESIC